MARRRNRKVNRGWLQKGFDARRHILTEEERRRGGLSCAKKLKVQGRWFSDWWDRWARRRKSEKGEWVDEETTQ
jgi:hypothetical protein